VDRGGEIMVDRSGEAVDGGLEEPPRDVEGAIILVGGASVTTHKDYRITSSEVLMKE